MNTGLTLDRVFVLLYFLRPAALAAIVQDN